MKSFLRCSLFLLMAVTTSSVICGSSLLAEVKKQEEKGIWVERKEGGKLNLLIDKNNFELHFYDDEKEPIEPDVKEGMLHYTSRIVSARESLLLSSAEREEKIILTSPRFIRPPYQFEILLVLNPEQGKEPETYHIIFRQEAEPDLSPSPYPW